MSDCSGRSKLLRSTSGYSWALATRRPFKTWIFGSLVAAVFSLGAVPSWASETSFGGPTTDVERQVASVLSRGEGFSGPDKCLSTSGPGGCPEISAAFVARLITQTETSPRATAKDVLDLRDVSLKGALDVSGRHLVRGLLLTGTCSLAGLDLHNASAGMPVEVGCLFTGPANLSGFKSSSSLSLRHSRFEIQQVGSGANVACNVSPDLAGYQTDVGGDLNLSQIEGLSRDITLSESTIGGTLWLSGTHISNRNQQRGSCTVSLQAIRVGRDIDVGNITVGAIGAEDASVAGKVSAISGCAGSLSLAGASVGRLAIAPSNKLVRCDQRTDLNAANLVVGRGIAAGVEFQPGQSTGVSLGRVVLAGAHIGDNVDFRNATIGSFEAADLRVGGRLTMATSFNGNVDLAGAEVHDDLDITAAPSRGDTGLRGHYPRGLVGDSLSVGGSVYMSGGHFFDDGVRLVRVKIGGNIDMKGASATRIDLSSSVVNGEVRLWPVETGTLSLAGASAGSIDEGDTRNADESSQKPPSCKSLPQIEFTGLTYSALAGFDAPRTDILDRPSWWLQCMLARQSKFAFQPYREMATRLRSAGYPDKADDILRTGNWRDLNDSFCQGRWFAVFRSLLLWLIIGWGISTGYLHALFFAVLLSALGAEVLRATATPPNRVPKPWSWRILASASRFVPFKLGNDFDEFVDAADLNLGRRARIYFFVHSVLGLLIVACVAAGVAGFTQAVS